MVLVNGIVKNGVIVLEEGVTPPSEGTPVRVLYPARSTGQVAKNGGSATGESLSEVLLRFAGVAKGMPPDFARNHDHYIHGTPKRAEDK